MIDKQKKIFEIVLVVLFIFFGIYRIFSARLQKEKNLTYTLETYANDFNEACPLPVGNDLIIEKVSFARKKTVVFEFVISKYSKDLLDLEQLEKKLSEMIVQDLESTNSLTILRNNNIIFEYRYFDTKNEEIFRLKALFNTPIRFID